MLELSLLSLLLQCELLKVHLLLYTQLALLSDPCAMLPLALLLYTTAHQLAVITAMTSVFMRILH
jgi:hypothetical protein